MKTKPQPKARITNIGLSRVYNTGNYTNLKLDLSVEVPAGVSVRKTLRALSIIVVAANPKAPVQEHEVKHAESILSDPQAWCKNITDAKQRKERIRSLVKESKEKIAKFRAWKRRRDIALAALDNLGGTITQNDAKLSWDDNDPWGDY